MQLLLQESGVLEAGRGHRSPFTLLSYSRNLVDQFRKAKQDGKTADPEQLVEVRAQLQGWLDGRESETELDTRQKSYVGYVFRRLATVNTELGDESAAAFASENMKKYLPEKEWDDSERRESRHPPSGGERGPSNRPPGPPRRDSTAPVPG